jgi:branched-chain amino acid transport system ATP-binding protein
MLRVKNLQVHYGMIHALRSVSVHVKEKEVVALIGGNGAGKTTLLCAATGLVRPTSGEVALDGVDVTKDKADRIVRKGIAHVPEGRHVFKPLSVEDNLLLGAYHRYSWRKAAAIHGEIEEVYKLFPVLGERRRQPAGTLSGGEQQMLVIGRALLSHPKVLLLDEPSMGLAPKVIREILDHVARLRAERGMTILLVEQNARAALSIADRGYVLETGRVVLQGSSEELLANRDVQRAYLGRDVER